jgi:hypothetical protein
MRLIRRIRVVLYGLCYEAGGDLDKGWAEEMEESWGLA